MTETIIQLPNGWTLRSDRGDNVWCYAVETLTNVDDEEAK